MKSLYIKLYKFFQKKAYEIERKSGAQVKCPNCSKWTHELVVDGDDYDITDTDYGFSMECGNCKHTSHWNCYAAPVAIPCDENGNIVELL